jgi:hypothetical protein
MDFLRSRGNSAGQSLAQNPTEAWSGFFLLTSDSK